MHPITIDMAMITIRSWLVFHPHIRKSISVGSMAPLIEYKFTHLLKISILSVHSFIFNVAQ